MYFIYQTLTLYECHKALIFKMKVNRNIRNLKNIENFQCMGDVVSNQSALVFRGRSILKKTYLNYRLLEDDEIKLGIKMPEDNFLLILPRIEAEGLSAAPDFLQFTKAGISISGCEGGYDHASREKLALLFILCNAELEKPLVNQFLILDELKGIKKMSDLADWISNIKSEKDVRMILEREHAPEKPSPRRAEPQERLLGKQQLSAILGISPRTIDRNSDQFYPIMQGKRKFYKLSECNGYQKKQGL